MVLLFLDSPLNPGRVSSFFSAPLDAFNEAIFNNKINTRVRYTARPSEDFGPAFGLSFGAAVRLPALRHAKFYKAGAPMCVRRDGHVTVYMYMYIIYYIYHILYHNTYTYIAHSIAYVIYIYIL